MSLPRLSLQAKYTSLIIFIILSTSIILSGYYYSALRVHGLTDLEATGRSAAISLAHNAEEGVLFSDTAHLELLIRLLAENPDVAGAEIVSANGDTLVKTGTAPDILTALDQKIAKTVHTSTDETGMQLTEYRLYDAGVYLLDYEVPINTQRILRDREEIGFLFNDTSEAGSAEEVRLGTARVIFSSARWLQDIKAIQRRTIGITAAVIIIGIVITIPLVRLSMRPIRLLANGTKKIAAGDLSTRIEAETRDEIGVLAQSFNQMALDLEKYHAELREHSRMLEVRVIERTRALEHANEELELANAELRKAQAQLIQAGKMTAMGQFGAGVAHELNQPLAGIKGYAQLLLDMVPEDSPLRPRLEQIDKQASRMKDITQTMWNLARQSNFEYTFVDIKQPINDSLTLMNEQLRHHQIEVEIQSEESLPYAYGDANQLHQVFLNLLTNARDAVDEKGGGRIRISIRPIADNHFLQVLVMDNGRGVPPEVRDKIFDPFFTTKPPGKGTGLGLSINFSIIEQHHGFIEMYSVVSKGTVFSIMIPTDQFVACVKHPESTDPHMAAPCWAGKPASSSSADNRWPDCTSCEIYRRFQSPPETSFDEEFHAFLEECAVASSCEQQ